MEAEKRAEKMSALDYIKDRRIYTLLIVLALLVAADLYYGLHFGIEFVGGTQIPVTLQQSVNVTTMTSLIGALQQRLSSFGLSQVTVEGIGNQELYVVIPTISPSSVNQTINIIDSQGRFDGIVSGREALNGSGILKGSIGGTSQIVNGTAECGVTFYITPIAEKHFAATVLGQANKPLYMFLDRPTSAVVLLNASSISSSGIQESTALSAINQALAWGNNTIPVEIVSNNNQSMSSVESFFSNNRVKYTTVVTGYGMNASLLTYLKSLNYTIKQYATANITPVYTAGFFANQTYVQSWPAVGLLSSPVLNPSITNGNVSNSYQITGVAPSTLPGSQKLAYAGQQVKTIVSILNGGALPVAVVPGTPTTIPPTLGSHFLYVSGIVGVLAVVFVSIFITVRYRKIGLIAPIIITTLMELFIIGSILGVIGTIDLAGVAGMIAVIGTGVDAQVIITDEIIARKVDTSAKTLLGNAFYIVWTDALLLVIAMMPLFFSTSLVTVIGFSEATIIGAVLSVLITRPAYGAMISRRYAQ